MQCAVDTWCAHPHCIWSNCTVQSRPLLSGWLILYWGGGGSEDGWVRLSGFSLILGEMQVPGGVRFFGWVGWWVTELGRPPMSFMGQGTLCHMGMLPLCSDLFCFTLFHFSPYMVLEQSVSGTVSDPVDIAHVNQKKSVSANPVVHIFSTCYGVVNLNLFHPNCSVIPPPPLRVSGRWVGQPKSREGQSPPPPQYH